ncbi:hypothetical protein J6590_029942 [Homalodisca vitripennis]|nr:hypothetical protein J6590_029942 [Homalodisca vitripennis]
MRVLHHTSGDGDSSLEVSVKVVFKDMRWRLGCAPSKARAKDSDVSKEGHFPLVS